MTKFKSLIALCIVVAIVATCALSAAASITSTTSVIWNADETAASAKTVGTASAGTAFWVRAYIYSYSTGQSSESVSSTERQSTIEALAGPVAVTYPSQIPLIQYEGSHGTGAFS